MGLSCLFGHNWNGCKCINCGKMREEGHDWSSNCCKCSKCGKERSDRHEWNYSCKCSICGITRDTGHNWNHDCEKCSICGKTLKNSHTWDGCKCSKCGKTRNESHVWDGCKCSKCGITREKEHAWDGCKCSKCGKIRDESHVWNGCKCSKCGIPSDKHHIIMLHPRPEFVLHPREDEYYENCSICGQMSRDHVHQWDKCLCYVCGTDRDELHDWSQNCEKCSICGAWCNNGHNWLDNRCSKCHMTQNSLLYNACKENDLKLVIKYLEEGSQPDSINDKGDTPLNIATINGFNNIARLLIEKGADPMVINKEGCNPLVSAIHHYNMELVNSYVNSGINVNPKGVLRYTPLMEASINGYADIVELLVNKGAIIDLKDRGLNTAIIYASGRGHNKVVELLASKGADLNQRDRYGNPLIFIAAKYRKKDTIRLLVDLGCDVNALDFFGRPILYEKLKDLDYDEDTKILLTNLGAKKYVSNVLNAIDNNNIGELNNLINQGIDIDCFYDDSILHSNALCFAIYEKNDEIVRLLLRKGANPNIQVHDFGTPLHFAANYGTPSIVNMLIDQGAIVNIVSSVYLGINDSHNDGVTPLMLSIHYGPIECPNTELFIERGANVNSKTSHGITALHIATHECNLNVIKILLDHGADINAKSDEGKTALDIAQRKNKYHDFLDVIDFLRNYNSGKPRNSSHLRSTSTIILDSDGEIVMINAVLNKTFNADIFKNAVKDIGFKYEHESVLGLEMESKFGRIILQVKASIHSTDIATLLYFDKSTEKTTYFIEDGVRCK